MVYLILTRHGYEALIAELGALPAVTWVGGDVMTRTQIQEARAAGNSLTVLNYSVQVGASDSIEDALQTVREHHPGEVIFVES